MDLLTPIWPDAPRRAPGLRLPPYRFRPGCDPRPGDGHVELADPFESGVDLYHQGYLWEAHEAWEEALRAGGDRALLKGLIQLAAGLLKAHLGNEEGVRKLFARSDGYLAASEPAHGLDPAAVRAAMARYLKTRRWSDAPRLGGPVSGSAGPTAARR